MGELSKEKPVVVYCAYGFHVGCRTAIALRDAGFDARYMNVGHVEYHGGFSQAELARLDRRHDQRAEDILLEALRD